MSKHFLWKKKHCQVKTFINSMDNGTEYTIDYPLCSRHRYQSFMINFTFTRAQQEKGKDNLDNSLVGVID